MTFLEQKKRIEDGVRKQAEKLAMELSGKKMDVATHREISDAIQFLLRPLEKEWGIAFTAKGGTYDPNGKIGMFKFEASIVDEDGNVSTREAEDFRLYASRHRIPLSVLGTTITIHGKEFEILGYMPKSTKYSVLAKRVSTGSSVKLIEHEVRKAIAKEGLLDEDMV